jgi:predicted SAM-dependent methyltransferase
MEPELVEQRYQSWSGTRSLEYFIKSDIFTFLERTTMVFDRICIYRFLEHVPFDKVLYFIYLLSTVTRPGGIIDVIVPNYKILAQMILDEDPLKIKSNENFEAQNILLTTELVNEPSCPHASIWTDDRSIYFFQFEKRFEVMDFDTKFNFDGRNIYLRFFAKRV